MTAPVLTFFNNKGGVGKTSLIYHLAWMYADLGFDVLAADLDPQAVLTGMFLDEDIVERLWSDGIPRKTVYGALQPLLERTGDIATPHVEKITPQLQLLAGDLKLSSSEEELSSQWPRCLDRDQGAFRVISSLWRTLQKAAEQAKSQIILVDVGPNLGALNRAALIATDYVVVPLGADLYSLQGLRNLGPTLRDWRQGWEERLERNPVPDLPMPAGGMRPIGYVVQQHSVRLNRPVFAYDKWVKRVPEEYRNNLAESPNPNASSESADSFSLSTIKHYRSLLPMSQEAHKPIFKLNAADGALGSHAALARAAYTDFKELAEEILRRTGISLDA